jgi:hypothetical protein
MKKLIKKWKKMKTMNKNEKKWKSNEKKLKFNKKKIDNKWKRRKKKHEKKEGKKNPSVISGSHGTCTTVHYCTIVLLYYYSKNKARETPTSGCAWAHPRAHSVGTRSTTQHFQKHPKKGRETQLPVAHARSEGIPSMSRDIGSLPVLRFPVRAASGHFQSRDFR